MTDRLSPEARRREPYNLYGFTAAETEALRKSTRTALHEYTNAELLAELARRLSVEPQQMRDTAMMEIKELREMIAALAPFLAIWAVQYQQHYQLDGLHPVHFDLLAKAGARMDGFNRATNAQH